MERFSRDARVLECLDGDLEEQTLLRIDPVGFARGDTEEVGVERIDVVEERSPLGGFC